MERSRFRASRSRPTRRWYSSTGIWASHWKAVWGLGTNQEGDTVVLITHDNSIAVKAKRIVRLQDGRIIYDGDASDPQAVVQPQEDAGEGEPA